MPQITQAFVLGAGLGTRLRPLTEQLPKPLVPIFQKPMITFALDHLIDAGCEKFCVNTHHQPRVFRREVPGKILSRPAAGFRHEPVLLETGGRDRQCRGLVRRRSRSWFTTPTFSRTCRLAPLLEEHARAGNIGHARAALTTPGRSMWLSIVRAAAFSISAISLGTGSRDEFVFTGIYAVQPEFLALLQPGVKRSVIPTLRRDDPARREAGRRGHR